MIPGRASVRRADQGPRGFDEATFTNFGTGRARSGWAPRRVAHQRGPAPEGDFRPVGPQQSVRLLLWRRPPRRKSRVAASPPLCLSSSSGPLHSWSPWCGSMRRSDHQGQAGVPCRECANRRITIRGAAKRALGFTGLSSSLIPSALVTHWSLWFPARFVRRPCLRTVELRLDFVASFSPHSVPAVKAAGCRFSTLKRIGTSRVSCGPVSGWGSTTLSRCG